MDSENGFTVDIEFSISDAKHGWFYASVSAPDQYVFLENSNVGGLCLPEALLDTLTELSDKKIQEEWVCWHGEDTSDIWHLRIREDILNLRVFHGGCSFGLPVRGDPLPRISEDYKLVFDAGTYFYAFAHNVMNAFKYYSYGEGSDIWNSSGFGAFPKESFSGLRKSLRTGGYN